MQNEKFYSKKEEKIRKHSDEKKKKEFIQKVTGILYKYGDIESTPMLDKRIQDIYNEYYEEETDYVALNINIINICWKEKTRSKSI